MRFQRWALFVLVLLLFGAAFGRDRFDHWIETTDLPTFLPDLSAEVRDRNGSLLRAYTAADGRWRLAVTPGAVDPGFVRMLIAYEDKRFYTHPGVDPWAVLRAMAQSARHGTWVSGASTLTMQVARLIEHSGTGAWRGKIRQMRVALAMERVLSKPEILELYLTLAPYGGNLEGIRAATLSYFGKEPRRLSAAEAALLVALPQAPEARRPDLAHAKAHAARQIVLERLEARGVVRPEEARTAYLEPVPHLRRPFAQLAPHLADRVTSDRPDQNLHRLTLSKPLQIAAETLAQQALSGKESRLSIAMVLADHHSGEILAHVGSAGYSDRDGRQGFIDMTRALRSPGSTLKPLVYGLAFDRGLAHPATLIHDRPMSFGSYAPQNFDGQFRGELPVGEALRLSLNIPVVMLTEEIGPANLMAALRRAGVTARLPGGQAGLAIALGGLGTTLESLVQLYAGIAQLGQTRPLHWRQASAPEAQPTERFLVPASAWHLGHILAGLPPPASAAKERLAYKTGTSYGHRDAWAIGFDGRYVAGVWIGRADGTPVPGAFGGELAAPVLFELVGLASDRAEPLAPPPPETLLAQNSQLPAPLRRFKGRRALFEAPQEALKLAFPPDGARLSGLEDGLLVKVRDGTPPYTWLANGAPVLSGTHAREAILTDLEPGFVHLSVIDKSGQSARASVFLTP